MAVFDDLEDFDNGGESSHTLKLFFLEYMNMRLTFFIKTLNIDYLLIRLFKMA